MDDENENQNQNNANPGDKNEKLWKMVDFANIGATGVFFILAFVATIMSFNQLNGLLFTPFFAAFFAACIVSVIVSSKSVAEQGFKMFNVISLAIAAGSIVLLGPLLFIAGATGL